MAILVTNQSHFKPLSFDEMIRPYQMLTEEYNKREAEISALDAKAETMRQYADNEIRANLLIEGKIVNEDNINQWIKDHPNSFATQYMNYADSLDKAAEDLATKGLRGTNRKTIYDLTNQYQTNVVPIETALKTRTAKSDEQRKAKLANPDLRFDRDFSTIGLQELIDNPDLSYTSYNLKDFEKRGALSGASILGRLTKKTTLDPSEQWYNITKGVSQNDLIRWQSGDTDASHYDDVQSIAALNTAREEATKIANTVPENLREEVFNRVFENSVNAMKQTTRERTNANFMSDIQRNAESRAQQSYLWNISKSGYKIGERGKIVADPESPHWTAQDVYPEYVKNSDGTNELDIDGNPKIKWEKRKSTGTTGSSNGKSSSSSSSSSGKGSSGGRELGHTKITKTTFDGGTLSKTIEEKTASGDRIQIVIPEGSGNIEIQTIKGKTIASISDINNPLNYTQGLDYAFKPDSKKRKIIDNLIYEIIEDYKREGASALQKYRYYLDIDNKSYYNESLERLMPAGTNSEITEEDTNA